MSRRKSIAKLKATNQEERKHLWKQHFENLFGKSPKVTDDQITKIICNQLDIKLGQFTHEEFEYVIRKIKNRKAPVFGEIRLEVLKIREFDDILLRHWNAVYCPNSIGRWTKGCILPFPKKCDLGVAKNYPYIHSG